jgi:hypothetical protein
MRRYRKRRRLGSRQAKVTLDSSAIEALIGMGRLEAEARHDPESLRIAVMGLIYKVLDDPTCFAMLTLRRGRRSP